MIRSTAEDDGEVLMSMTDESYDMIVPIAISDNSSGGVPTY
jgi:hypothetical protein